MHLYLLSLAPIPMVYQLLEYITTITTESIKFTNWALMAASLVSPACDLADAACSWAPSSPGWRRDTWSSCCFGILGSILFFLVIFSRFVLHSLCFVESFDKFDSPLAGPQSTTCIRLVCCWRSLSSAAARSGAFGLDSDSAAMCCC